MSDTDPSLNVWARLVAVVENSWTLHHEPDGFFIQVHLRNIPDTAHLGTAEEAAMQATDSVELENLTSSYVGAHRDILLLQEFLSARPEVPEVDGLGELRSFIENAMEPLGWVLGGNGALHPS